MDLPNWKLDWSSWRVRLAFLIVAFVLLLSPFLGYTIFYRLNPAGHLVGTGNGIIDEDTYVTSVDNDSHLEDATLRVGNQSEGLNGIVEIGYLRFTVMPPPAGSYLSDLYLELKCVNVDSGGVVRLHRVSPNEAGFSFENLSYATRAPYESHPFANLSVDRAGNYTVRLFVDGGFKDYANLAVIAITADLGTKVSFYSSEAPEGQIPQIVFYSPFGLAANLWENPAAAYLNPLALFSLSAGFVVLGFAVSKSFRATLNGGSSQDSVLSLLEHQPIPEVNDYRYHRRNNHYDNKGYRQSFWIFHDRVESNSIYNRNYNCDDNNESYEETYHNRSSLLNLLMFCQDSL